MVEKYADGVAPVPSANAKTPHTDRDGYSRATEEFRFSDALALVWELVRAGNQEIENTKPWAMAKEGKEEVKDVLAFLLTLLRDVSDMLLPYLPETAERMKRALAAPGEKINKGEPLFPKKDSL
jgi:methionyl-tRNA synthetase